MANKNQNAEIFYLLSSFIGTSHLPNTVIELIKSMRKTEGGDVEMMRLLSICGGEAKEIELL